MSAKIGVWLFFRAVRWLAWIVFFGWSLYFHLDRVPHLNSFGHLLPYAEALWFTSATAAVFVGFLELWARERAGLTRPRPGQLIPPRTAPDALH